MRVSILLLLAAGLAGCGQQAESGENIPGSTKNSGQPGALAYDAAGVPRFRPGAWEYKLDTDEGAEIARICLGDAGNAELREILTRRYPPECTVERSADARNLTFRSTCKQNGLTMETSLDVTGSDTAIDMKLGLFVTTPAGDRSGETMVTSFRRTGECPAGVKPGDDIGR